jgi:hypothetical protein
VSPRKPKPIPISVLPGSEMHVRLMHLLAHAAAVGQLLQVALEMDPDNSVQLDVLQHNLQRIRDESVEILLNLAGVEARSRKRRRRKAKAEAPSVDEVDGATGLPKLASVALNKWEAVAMLHAWTAACCALVGFEGRWHQAMEKFQTTVDENLQSEGVDVLTTRFMQTVRLTYPSVTVDPESEL